VRGTKRAKEGKGLKGSLGLLRAEEKGILDSKGKSSGGKLASEGENREWRKKKLPSRRGERKSIGRDTAGERAIMESFERRGGLR